MMIAAGLLVAIIGGVIGHLFSITVEAELYTRFIASGAIIVSIYFVHRARSAWDGELARYLEIIGAGFIVLMLSWVPHIGWHIRGQPEILGLSASFLIGLFHTLAAVTFLIVGYGFYRFWQEG
jgi:uncharacterized membrane protein YfcA